MQATQTKVDQDRQTVEAGLRFLASQRLGACLHLAFNQWKIAQVTTSVQRRETALLAERQQLLDALQVCAVCPASCAGSFLLQFTGID